MKTKVNKPIVIIWATLILISSLFFCGCSNENKNSPCKIHKVYSRHEYNSILHTTIYFACVDIQNISNDTIEVYMIYDCAGLELKSNTQTILPEKYDMIKVEIPGFEYTKVYPEKITIMWTKV